MQKESIMREIISQKFKHVYVAHSWTQAQGSVRFLETIHRESGIKAQGDLVEDMFVIMSK